MKKFIKVVNNIERFIEKNVDENGNEFIEDVREELMPDTQVEFIPVHNIVKIYVERSEFGDNLTYIFYDEVRRRTVKYKEKLPSFEIQRKIEYLEKYLCK